MDETLSKLMKYQVLQDPRRRNSKMLQVLAAALRVILPEEGQRIEALKMVKGVRRTSDHGLNRQTGRRCAGSAVKRGITRSNATSG